MANAEFELQLTDLYSPAEDHAEGVTLGAAGSTVGVASVDEGLAEGVAVGSETANTVLKEEIAITAMLVRARDLIGKERKENKYTWT